MLNIVIAAGLLLFYYQVVAVVSPRLTRAERRYAYGSLPLVGLCFLLGAAFSFFVALPSMLGLLENFRINGFTFHVYVHVPLLMGSVFELLFIMYMLALLGIVSPRQMSGVRRYAVVGALLAAAIFTLWPLRSTWCSSSHGVIYASVRGRHHLRQGRRPAQEPVKQAGATMSAIAISSRSWRCRKTVMNFAPLVRDRHRVFPGVYRRSLI